MKYYYLNKVAMAVLLALLLFFGTRTLIDIVYEEHLPATPGYEVAGAEEDLVHGDEKKKGDGEDKGAAFIAALNKADPAKGEQAAGLCKVCHSFEKGGPNMIGPGVYGVVGHKIAAHEGFSYSAALKDHGGEWTFENLDHWLENPAGFAPGTTMAFPGIKDLQKRADVIAYLNQNSDDPLPIPEPVAAPAEDEESAEAEESPDEAAPEILSLMAEADPAKGEQSAALCKVCHTFEAGGANGIGPNLHNIVGAKVGHLDDYAYSAALKDKGGDWTYVRLDEWLKSPATFAPGTTMAFPGIADAKTRADVIAYLRSQTENPPELPAGDAAAAPAEEEAKSENADDPGMAEEDAAPAEEKAEPADEAAPAEDEAMPAEEPAAEESMDEAAPAEEKAMPAEEAAPAEDETMPAEEPAAEKSSDSDADTPAKAEDSASDSDTIVNSPKVSEDAPSLPHKGEAPSPNQPQPVVPSDSSSETMEADEPNSSDEGASSSDDSDSMSDDSASTSSQPQPVYPDGKPDGI